MSEAFSTPDRAALLNLGGAPLAGGRRIVSVNGGDWLVDAPANAPVDIPLEQPYETVHHPRHYDHPVLPGVQAIDMIEDFPYNIGSAMAYLWRCGRKPGVDPVEDLRKAIEHIQREIGRLQRGAPCAKP